MNYTIMHETRRSVRVRYDGARWSRQAAAALRNRLSRIEGVEQVTVFPAVGGVYLEYGCSREEALALLNGVCAEDLTPLAPEEDDRITAEEMERRKLHPEVKKQMRNEILAEAAADLILPAPAQFAFHLWQLASLRTK